MKISKEQAQKTASRSSTWPASCFASEGLTVLEWPTLCVQLDLHMVAFMVTLNRKRL